MLEAVQCAGIVDDHARRDGVFVDSQGVAKRDEHAAHVDRARFLAHPEGRVVDRVEVGILRESDRDRHDLSRVVLKGGQHVNLTELRKILASIHVRGNCHFAGFGVDRSAPIRIGGARDFVGHRRVYGKPIDIRASGRRLTETHRGGARVFHQRPLRLGKQLRLRNVCRLRRQHRLHTACHKRQAERSCRDRRSASTRARNLPVLSGHLQFPFNVAFSPQYGHINRQIYRFSQSDDNIISATKRRLSSYLSATAKYKRRAQE